MDLVKKKMEINSKVLVVGGSSGLGLSIAKKLCLRGYNISILGSNIKKLDKAKRFFLKKYKSKINIFNYDLTVQKQTQKILNKIGKNNLDYQILIYSAGMGYYEDFSKSSSIDNEKVIKLNVLAFTNIVNFFVKHMLKHKKKSYIVSIGSLAGFVPDPNFLLYGSTKKFIEVFTAGLAENLKKTNISLSLVAPGSINTSFLKNSKNPKKGSSMDSDTVAEILIGKFLQEQRLIVPGLINTLRYYAFSFLPKKVIFYLFKNL
jgi:short-subunit dehydrogenase